MSTLNKITIAQHCVICYNICNAAHSTGILGSAFLFLPAFLSWYAAIRILPTLKVVKCAAINIPGTTYGRHGRKRTRKHHVN